MNLEPRNNGNALGRRRDNSRVFYHMQTCNRAVIVVLHRLCFLTIKPYYNLLDFKIYGTVGHQTNLAEACRDSDPLRPLTGSSMAWATPCHQVLWKSFFGRFCIIMLTDKLHRKHNLLGIQAAQSPQSTNPVSFQLETPGGTESMRIQL